MDIKNDNLLAAGGRRQAAGGRRQAAGGRRQVIIFSKKEGGLL